MVIIYKPKQLRLKYFNSTRLTVKVIGFQNSLTYDWGDKLFWVFMSDNFWLLNVIPGSLITEWGVSLFSLWIALPWPVWKLQWHNVRDTQVKLCSEPGVSNFYTMKVPESYSCLVTFIHKASFRIEQVSILVLHITWLKMFIEDTL